ncbi:hypothetical protein Goklo_021733, partial [Gossypium klotzschianum]|nr:hypothetical protein [Gossypium klotzschianum]
HKEGERIHLLHLLRVRLLVEEEKPWWWRFIERRFINEARTKRYHSRTIGTVKELKKAGITLKASETSCLTDISFNHIFFSGKLRLPPITVDDSTINLIAYEMCPDFDNDFTVTSYMCFLDLLIDEAEDVKDLRDAGILYNRLGSDEEVAKLFNKMNTDLVPSPMIYSGVKEKIHNHCKNMWINHAAQGYHTYFRSPWTFLAFLGAIAALTLSALQTYYAMHQQNRLRSADLPVLREFMATSNDSVSTNTGNPSNFQPANSRLIQSFPRHDTVKLDESNFVQWQHHISLIVEGYELTGFLDGTLPAPPRFIQSQEGPPVSNPEASLFHQQDKLLASWLLSTVSSPLLSYFTNARSACDVWTTATRLFAAATGAKLSRI